LGSCDSKFNSLSQDGDPNTKGIDFLDNVYFTHQYYDSHSITINPGNHNLFSSSKLRAMWSKIRGDHDLVLTNFTKSGNHNSSFTAMAKCKILQLQRGEQNDDEEDSNEEGEELDEDPEGVNEHEFAHFTRLLPEIYL
jgi:hypothetical protein